MNICFIIDKDLSPNSYAFIFPIILNKNNLRYKIHIAYKIPDQKYDLIFIDSKYYNNKFNQNDFDFIKNDLIKLKNISKILIYSDNEASVFINDLIFDYVDIYLKGRLPSNLNTYKKRLYGQRHYTDFYHKKIGILDNTENYSNIISDQNLKKIRLGWNNGICDYSYYSFIKKKIFQLTGKIFFKLPKITTYKKNIISGRFKQNYNRNTISYQRKTFEKLCINICDTGRVNRYKYFDELKNSIFSLSPFGWGEICYRDFETFLYSSILIKPDMSHLITWPDYYIKNKTYIPLSWDIANSYEIEKIINEKDKYFNIAQDGYLNYVKYFDNSNELLFEKHFKKIVSDIIT